MGYCSENGLQTNDSSNGIDIQTLLEGLSSLSTRSKSHKRVIKLPIFPEDYDKTIMPPKENGKKFTFSLQKIWDFAQKTRFKKFSNILLHAFVSRKPKSNTSNG